MLNRIRSKEKIFTLVTTIMLIEKLTSSDYVFNFYKLLQKFTLNSREKNGTVVFPVPNIS